MTVTIKDVAKAAGVSVSTVSRVINSKGVFPDETREKIFKTMKELNYYPNSSARNLVTGSPYAVGLIVDTEDSGAFSNEFFSKSVFGIETVVHSNGYNVIIASNRTAKNDLSSSEKLVYERKVDGLILPSSIVKKSFIGKLKQMKFPYVVLGEPDSVNSISNWVDINNALDSELAIDHLFEKGFRNIAFISSGMEKKFNRDRLAGYKRGLSKYNLETDVSFICDGKMSVEGGYEKTLSLLQREHRPDAVILGDSIMAFGALRAIKESGLNVPKDIGVMCFGNSLISEVAEPRLTTVDVNTFELGVQAAQILLQSIQKGGEVLQQLLISSKIIERESTNKK